MLQWFNITVDPDTSKANADETEIKIDNGIITEWRVEIPRGHAGLTGFQVHDKNVSIFPRQRQNWISGDDTKFSVQDEYTVKKASKRLVFKAYNTDDTYPHTFKLGVNVLSMKSANIQEKILYQLIRMGKALGVK